MVEFAGSDRSEKGLSEGPPREKYYVTTLSRLLQTSVRDAPMPLSELLEYCQVLCGLLSGAASWLEGDDAGLGLLDQTEVAIFSVRCAASVELLCQHTVFDFFLLNFDRVILLSAQRSRANCWREQAQSS